MSPLEFISVVDPIFDDHEVVSLRFDLPSCKGRLLVVYFSQRFIRGGRGVRVRRGLLHEVGREAHLLARRRALRALPYLSFWLFGAAAGVESCVATLALVARRRSSRARQYRLAAGLPQQICVALSVALKRGAELQFLRSSTHLACTKALHSLRVPGKALQTMLRRQAARLDAAH